MARSYLVLGYDVSEIEKNDEEFNNFVDGLTISLICTPNGCKYFGYIMAEADENYICAFSFADFQYEMSLENAFVVNDAARERYGLNEETVAGNPEILLVYEGD